MRSEAAQSVGHTRLPVSDSKKNTLMKEHSMFMATKSAYDAIVVGSGPNGLAAAITIARTGRSVLVFEAKETIGGGCRSGEITLPGFTHDRCSAIHPLGLASPFLRTLPLAKYGIEWIHPAIPLAHPLDDGTAAIMDRSLEATAESLGEDATAYKNLMQPLVENWQEIIDAFYGPLRPRAILPHPFKLAQFGLLAIRSANALARSHFKGSAARAIFAGMSEHSILPLDAPTSAAAGLMLSMLAHAVGWPIAGGGSQKIADALAAYLRDLGGEIVTGVEVQSLDELPPARVVLCDITPRQLLRIAGKRLSGRPRWRHTHRNRQSRTRGLAWRASQTAVRPARAAEPLRSHPRPGWQTDSVGILPRPQRLDHRYERAHRGPD